MKKIIVGIIAILMMVTMLAGCTTTEHTKVTTVGYDEYGNTWEEVRYEINGVEVPASLIE